MKSVFVDTSGFYAFLDRDDRFHTEAKRLFLNSKKIPHARLGTVVADQKLTIQTAGKPYAWPLENLRTAHEGTIPSLMSWEK